MRKVLKAVAHGRKQWTSTRQSNDKCKDGEEKGRDRGSSHSRRRKDASKVELIDQGGLLGQSLLSRPYAETPAELINDNDTVEEMIIVTGSSHSGCGLEENGRGERTDEYSMDELRADRVSQSEDENEEDNDDESHRELDIEKLLKAGIPEAAVEAMVARAGVQASQGADGAARTTGKLASMPGPVVTTMPRLVISDLKASLLGAKKQLRATPESAESDAEIKRRAKENAHAQAKRQQAAQALMERLSQQLCRTVASEPETYPNLPLTEALATWASTKKQVRSTHMAEGAGTEPSPSSFLGEGRVAAVLRIELSRDEPALTVALKSFRFHPPKDGAATAKQLPVPPLAVLQAFERELVASVALRRQRRDRARSLSCSGRP